MEGPVEYLIPHAVQGSLARELDTDTHQHFASKLRALKRSAMTDVLLGEIRDAETAQAFTDLVTSGVRVFTTVHAAGVHLITQRLSSSFIGVEREVLDTPGILRLLVHQELRSEEHTSELQSRGHIVCRLLLEKKKIKNGAKLSRKI